MLTDSHMTPTRAPTRHSQSRRLHYGPSGSRARSTCQREDPAHRPTAEHMPESRHRRRCAGRSRGPRAQGRGTSRAFVRTVRVECLDRLLIVSCLQVESVLGVFVGHTTPKGRIARSSSSPRNPGEPPPTPTIGWSGATTPWAASSTSATKPPPYPRKQIWRPYPRGCWNVNRFPPRRGAGRPKLAGPLVSSRLRSTARPRPAPMAQLMTCVFSQKPSSMTMCSPLGGRS
jgi:hypothetical protein